VQTPGGNPPFDLARSESKLQKLAARDRAVLLSDQSPDRSMPAESVLRLVI
jgi:hypothetical protein